jgi:hypothetical protein
MLRLVPELPDAVSYGGGRLLGVHLDGLGDRVAQTEQGRRGLLAPARYDVGELTSTGGRAAVSYETEAEPISLASIHIDRAACAWLIRRHIDPDAQFVFVTDPAEVPPDAAPFDMRGVELGHHGGDCSFETILHRRDLTDPVLWKIAEIVHEADLDDERYDAPEAPGLDVVLRGLSMIHSDEEILALTGPVFDGLYEYHRRAAVTGREPA